MERIQFQALARHSERCSLKWSKLVFVRIATEGAPPLLGFELTCIPMPTPPVLIQRQVFSASLPAAQISVHQHCQWKQVSPSERGAPSNSVSDTTSAEGNLRRPVPIRAHSAPRFRMHSLAEPASHLKVLIRVPLKLFTVPSMTGKFFLREVDVISRFVLPRKERRLSSISSAVSGTQACRKLN